MGKLRFKGKLGKGEKVTGEVDRVDDNKVTLKLKDESFCKIEVPEEIAELIDDDYDGNIITIENDNGEMVIDDHDDEWPEEKGK